MKSVVVCFVVFGLLLTAPLAFAGSGTRVVMVIYHSDPEGAKVMDVDGLIGVTPLVTRYEITDAYLAGECMRVRSLLVMWITGVHFIQKEAKVCPENGLNQQEITFTIPTGKSSRYISAFSNNFYVLQAAKRIQDMMNGIPLLDYDADQAALSQAYQLAADEAHEDLGRRIANSKARIQVLDGAIQAQRYRAAAESVVRDERRTFSPPSIRTPGYRTTSPTHSIATPTTNPWAPPKTVTCTTTELAGTGTVTCKER